jgi:hypothetical protein
MSLYRKLLGTGLVAVLLALSTGARATPAAEQWLNDYYKKPAPEQFASAFLELSDSGYFEKPGNLPLAIGFIASVFAQNPGRVNEWMDLTRSVPEAHQRILVAALWYSGNAKGPAYVREFARDANPALRRELLARVDSKPDVRSASVQSVSSLNLQWGAFLATGDKTPVRNILAALGTNDNAQLTQDVRWSLAQNAAQHQRVLAICRDELSRQPNAIRETLRAVINDTEHKQQPST